MANEKRLIDAYALIEDIEKRYCEPCKAEGKDYCEVACRACWVDDMILEIDPAPTVDAVEVVHGHWEDEYGGEFANPRYRCSVCKGKALYRFDRDCLGGWHEVQALTDYCPNCGAKMDGDGNG